MVIIFVITPSSFSEHIGKFTGGKPTDGSFISVKIDGNLWINNSNKRLDPSFIISSSIFNSFSYFLLEERMNVKISDNLKFAIGIGATVSNVSYPKTKRVMSDSIFWEYGMNSQVFFISLQENITYRLKRNPSLEYSTYLRQFIPIFSFNSFSYSPENDTMLNYIDDEVEKKYDEDYRPSIFSFIAENNLIYTIPRANKERRIRVLIGINFDFVFLSRKYKYKDMNLEPQFSFIPGLIAGVKLLDRKY